MSDCSLEKVLHKPTKVSPGGQLNAPEIDIYFEEYPCKLSLGGLENLTEIATNA